jgi:hypothetical protein
VKKRNISAFAGNRTLFPSLPVRRMIIGLTELSRLHNFSKYFLAFFFPRYSLVPEINESFIFSAGHAGCMGDMRDAYEI